MLVVLFYTKLFAEGQREAKRDFEMYIHIPPDHLTLISPFREPYKNHNPPLLSFPTSRSQRPPILQRMIPHPTMPMHALPIITQHIRLALPNPAIKHISRTNAIALHGADLPGISGPLEPAHAAALVAVPPVVEPPHGEGGQAVRERGLRAGGEAAGAVLEDCRLRGRPAYHGVLDWDGAGGAGLHWGGIGGGGEGERGGEG